MDKIIELNNGDLEPTLNEEPINFSEPRVNDVVCGLLEYMHRDNQNGYNYRGVGNGVIQINHAPDCRNITATQRATIRLGGQYRISGCHNFTCL